MKKTMVSFDESILPDGMRAILGKARFYDSSCSEHASTYFVEGECLAFLKIGRAHSLYREKVMQDYLSALALAAKSLAYASTGDQDFLLSSVLPGEDAIYETHKANPYRLAQALGWHLRKLHSLPLDACPFPCRSAEMILESEENIRAGYMDRQIVHEEPCSASEKFHKLKHLAKEEVIIHGDYCLPNIIMQDFELSGFVDVGGAGIGDRHYDLWWGIWSLNYNLGSYKYTSVFLDAYGREDIDPQRLKLCRYLAAFTK